MSTLLTAPAATSNSGGRGSGRGKTSRPTRSPAQRAAYRRRSLIAWGFSLPFAIVFAVFMLLPIISSFAMSFTDFTASDIRSPFAVNFAGLDQYVALFSDERFVRSLGVTAIFVVVGIPLTIAVALAFALALNTGRGKLVSFFRVGFYAPVVTSIVAVSVVWRYILQDDGLLNSALAVIGIDGPNWLNDTNWALPSLIVMAIWRNVGTLMVIFLAGLQSIPTEVKEAALVDGARSGRRLVSITLPLLRPTILLGAVLISVGYLQFFEEAFVMTQGGPLDSTLSVAYYTYQQFGFGNYGLASAASYVLFLAIALLSLLQFRLLRSKD
ncbi:multiple sugar transport system permease protein [Microbacterium halimionae]|uniref:Multiple sugar transport system permease protein n=1 Tax=Microbacterium halimionae TaxID=1526413 RepID=A0A7W3JPQ3_9MICO|nr:sugar ABC transporter permease [Microbacterium halimionae]MBA8816745.1 multiple sugar transport system permease protein [Microbacterium halimionae]NII94959.1 multiple sugar transport system permease protein [Microbacterium halimionae]